MSTRVLIVDSNKIDTMRILIPIENSDPDVSVVTAKSISVANREITKSLVEHNPFNIVFVDLKVGKCSGAEFARRLIDIIVNVNVVIVTRDYDSAMNLSFGVDAVIIKDGVQNQMSNTLIANVRDLSTPRRTEKYPLDVTLNMWEASQHMHGMNDLIYLTKGNVGELYDAVEKLTAFTKVTALTDERCSVNCVAYPMYPGDTAKPLALQSAGGCTIKCLFCINHRCQRDRFGHLISYIRPLTSNEMEAQVYLAMLKTGIKDLFSESCKLGLVANFSTAGDALVHSLDACAETILQLSKINKPLVSFIITSVGRKDRLQKYINRYIELPRVTHYWSVNSTIPKVRDWLMPGTKDQSLEAMRDLYQEIAERSGRFVTASFAIFKGINDTDEDVEGIVKLFKGRPFRIKLMAGCPGSLRGHPDITPEEVLVFQKKLIRAGLENVRYRTIFGVKKIEGRYFGCGRTKPDLPVKRKK